jgi:hypothetical protein
LDSDTGYRKYCQEGTLIGTTNLKRKPVENCCLGPGKIDAQKMLDLRTKSAINSDNLQV